MEPGSASVQQQLAAIRDDRVHGATYLAQHAVWALARAASEPRATPKLVRETGVRLAQARPAMAAIANAVHLMLARLQERGWQLSPAPTLASQVIGEMQERMEKAAACAAALLPEQGVVLTCSFSGTVVLTLTEAWRQGKRFDALVLPSAGYGAALAEEARRSGVAARVVDTLPESFAAADTMGLIGADAVYPPDFVVNGAPSFGLALWCSDRRFPYHVVCDSLKVAARTPMAGDPLPPGMERIPFRYVTAVITESGPLDGK